MQTNDTSNIPSNVSFVYLLSGHIVFHMYWLLQSAFNGNRYTFMERNSIRINLPLF